MANFQTLLKRFELENEEIKARINDMNNQITNIEGIYERKEDHCQDIGPKQPQDNWYVDGMVFKPLVENQPENEKSDTIKNLYQTVKNDYKEFGTSISVNGRYDPKDKDEFIQQRDIKAIKSAINKYQKDTGRQIQPKMICIYEHAPGNLLKYHFHGIFRGVPNDCVAYIKRYCERYCGRTDISMIEKQEDYTDYMFKSYIPEIGIKHHIEIPEEFHSYDYFKIGYP